MREENASLYANKEWHMQVARIDEANQAMEKEAKAAAQLRLELAAEVAQVDELFKEIETADNDPQKVSIELRIGNTLRNLWPRVSAELRRLREELRSSQDTEAAAIATMEDAINLTVDRGKELAAAKARVAELLAQLPDGMAECTIRFNECGKGHGWLTATNWVQHECPTCERDQLRQQLAERDAEIERLRALQSANHGVDKQGLVICLPTPVSQKETNVEFRKNLETIKEQREQELPEEKFIDELAKRRINEVLFEIMPPMTTIHDLEDLALAIFCTVKNAWLDYANVEAVRIEVMGAKGIAEGSKT